MCLPREDYPFVLSRAHAPELIDPALLNMKPFRLNPKVETPPLTFALQALLARHEAYMASAERDRTELNERVEQLELDKAALEADNARAIAENRALLDQLELLNSSVAGSDVKIRTLEAALLSSQKAVRRLEGASSRAADMERHIAMLEMEQDTLQNTLTHSKEEARNAVLRWKRAERGIRDLQDQLERMEKEAREEQERHVEMMERMERQRAVERDLDSAAGRLKGAAAAKTLQDGKGASNAVVSHFVRDLLQDNANLQLGIAELREMLLNSNDEIQILREQLLHHQPIEGEVSAASTLRGELEPLPETEMSPPPVQRVAQEVHIHHHYHVDHPAAEPKKTKKKRQRLNSAVFSPPGLSPVSTPPQRLSHVNRASAHSAKASVSSASAFSNRWSLFSDNPSDFVSSSSVPSTPLSNPRNSLFDRGNVDIPNLPASPTTSVDATSPTWQATHFKRPSDVSMPSVVQTLPQVTVDGDLSQDDEQTPLARDTATCSDDAPELAICTTTDDESNTSTTAPSGEDDSNLDLTITGADFSVFDPSVVQAPRPSLRRVVSHESIMSLSNGLDIHTLKNRPSQLTLRPLLSSSPAGAGVSAITALPTIARAVPDGKRGSVVLRDNLELVGLGLGLPVPRRDDARVVSGPINIGRAHSPVPRVASSSGLGRFVAWRPWSSASNGNADADVDAVASPLSPTTTISPPPSAGGTATPTVMAASPSSALSLPVSVTPSAGSLSPTPMRSPRTPSSRRGSTAKDLSRASGINQPGAIPGFYEYWAAHQRRGPPSKVCPDVVDREALADGLGNG
jgi:hypothetical protein